MNTAFIAQDRIFPPKQGDVLVKDYYEETGDTIISSEVLFYPQVVCPDENQNTLCLIEAGILGNIIFLTERLYVLTSSMHNTKISNYRSASLEQKRYIKGIYLQIKIIHDLRIRWRPNHKRFETQTKTRPSWTPIGYMVFDIENLKLPEDIVI